VAGKTIAKLGEIAAERWGMFTTAQAHKIGISRKTLSGLAASGGILRVGHGVYRMAGAPETELEYLYVPWLALGGATLPPSTTGVPAVVVAGESAAITHGIGDWFPGTREFVIPSRRTTRLHDVRLRVRSLEPADVMHVDGLPALTVERTVADLVEQWIDRSLIIDALADAGAQGKLVSPRKLGSHLEPLARAHGADSGTALANQLLEGAGIDVTLP
jgi:predicted transcriptional regulator of viral defense system